MSDAQIAEPDVCDADVPWPPAIQVQPSDLAADAWVRLMQSAEIRALKDTGEMQREQIAALKQRVAALTEERDALSATLDQQASDREQAERREVLDLRKRLAAAEADRDDEGGA